MQACRAALQAPAGVGPRQPGGWRAPARPAPTSARPRLAAGPGSSVGQQRTTGGQPRLRQLSVAAAAKTGGGGRKPRGNTGRKSHAAEAQPELQAWLQQQGLNAAAADEHARRLAAVFSGDQHAALASLPATFAFCGSQGLSGLQTAQLLDRIAKTRRESVVSFADTAQVDWQLIEPYIAAHVQRLQQAGKRLPKYTSVASMLCGSKEAASMFVKPPGHVAAWLAAVSEHLPEAADVDRLLLSKPQAVRVPPDTTAASLRWCVEELQVPSAELAAFAGKAAALMNCKAESLQAKLAALQEALGAQLALHMAQKQPRLLSTNSDTMRGALQWLQQQFDDAEQLRTILQAAPQLLSVSADGLQRRADFLKRQHGWRPGDGQLAAWIDTHSQPFSNVDFDAPETQAKLQLYTGVLGLELTDCLDRFSGYLHLGVDTAAARYILVQERAPWLLCSQDGGPSLTWVIKAPQQLPACGAATKAEVLEFERSWPASEQGQQLLAVLRSGSTEGWPCPPSCEQADPDAF